MSNEQVISLINGALDKLRQDQQLTESALATQLGVDASAVYRWRRGTRLGKIGRVLIPLVYEYALGKTYKEDCLS